MKTSFIGRTNELWLLEDLFKLNKAVLVVCRGRRRIGKSRLIQEFGKKATHFIEFQGLPPRENITNKDQLDVFSEQFSAQTGFPKLGLESWSQAFSLLDKTLTDKKTVVLLDEISWMAQKDKDFAGRLKIAWDTEFKKHSKLILVLCGSVSSWLEKNILNNTGFAGRISCDIKLEELDIYSCNAFWGKRSDQISPAEKMKILGVTGGIPRYLEEIRPDLSAEENIKRLCFSKEGMLFSEFEHIFTDIFSGRSSFYKKILKALIYGSKDLKEICTSIHVEKSGTISEYLGDLIESGFVSKERSCNISTTKISKSAGYRLRDNYVRFYLRYIEERKEIISGYFRSEQLLENLVEWEIIQGFQFENLVLNNLNILTRLLGINPDTIRFAAPWFQKKTKQRKACQIDLLILTKYNIYICEMKFRKQINISVINEIKNKVDKLKIPRNLSLRPVLIYNGKLNKSVAEEGYFNSIINMADLLNTSPEHE